MKILFIYLDENSNDYSNNAENNAAYGTDDKRNEGEDVWAMALICSFFSEEENRRSI